MADYSKGFKRRVVQLWIQHGMSTNEISRTSDSLIFYLIKILQVTINEASKHKHIFSGFLYFLFFTN